MLDTVRRLFGHMLVYGSGEIVLFAVNFLLFPVYTRVLEPAGYGALGLLLALRAFLRPLNQLGLDESFLRFHYDCETDAERQALTGTTLLVIGAAGAAVLGAFLVAAPLVSPLLGGPEHTGALRLLAVNGFLAAFLCVPHGLLRARNEAARFARWTVGGGLGIVVLRLLLVVGLGWGVFGMMLADVVVSAALLAGLLPVAGRPAAWRCSWPLARDLLRYGGPRVPHALLRQTLGQADRFLLRLYLPVTEVGVYGAGATVANTLSMYREAFRRAWMPLAFERMSDADAPRLFARLATVAFGLLVFATLGLALFAGPLLRWLTPPEYHDAVQVAPLLAAGVAVHAIGVLPTTSLNVAKRMRPLPWATGAGALVTVAANVALVPPFGMRGAALASVAGSATLVAALAAAANRCYPIPYELGRLGRIAAAGAGLYAASHLGPQDASPGRRPAAGRAPRRVPRRAARPRGARSRCDRPGAPAAGAAPGAGVVTLPEAMSTANHVRQPHTRQFEAAAWAATAVRDACQAARMGPTHGRRQRPAVRGRLDVMSTDTKWIVGTGVAVIASVVGSAVAVIAVVVTLVGGVREDLRSFRTEVAARMEGFETRLRNVEIAFGQVDQRLLTIERILLPPREPASNRAGR